MIFYHATLGVFKDEILSEGLVPGGRGQRVYTWSEKKFVYLASSKELAKSFISEATIELDGNEDDEENSEETIREDEDAVIERLFKEGGIVIGIDSTKLDRKKLGLDPQWNASDDSDDLCYAYRGIIPPNYFVSVEEFEPG